MDLTQTYIDYAKDLIESKYSDSKDIRLQKLAFLENQKLPTKKHEDWLYTNISNFLPKIFQKSESSLEEKGIIKSAYSISIENGIFNKEKSNIPDGLLIEVSCISEDLTKNALSLFTEATSPEQINISIQEHANIDKPILIDLRQESNRNSSSIKITSESNSNSSLICFNSAAMDNSFSFENIHVDIKKNASIEFIKFNHEPKLKHYNNLSFDLEEKAKLNSFTITKDSLFNRNDITVNLNGEAAFANVHGLFNLEKNEHCDNFSLISHNVPKTESEQLFKGTLKDESRGIFTGKVLIKEGAFESNSNQLNKNLLLSSKAQVNTRPQLEVYNDDVKCAHGATTGQISDEELFYLESRGIPKEKAYKFLYRSFSGDVLDKIQNKNIKLYLQKEILGFNNEF